MKTLNDLKQDAGDKLTDLILRTVNDEKYAIDWFYNCNAPVLDNLTPSEYCSKTKDGKDMLYSRLIALAQGNCST